MTFDHLVLYIYRVPSDIYIGLNVCVCVCVCVCIRCLHMHTHTHTHISKLIGFTYSAVMTIFEWRPFCLIWATTILFMKLSHLFPLTFLQSNYLTVLPAATLVTNCLCVLWIRHSFPNLRLGQGIFNYGFVWLVCVLGSCLYCAVFRFVCLPALACGVPSKTTQVFYFAFIKLIGVFVYPYMCV